MRGVNKNNKYPINFNAQFGRMQKDNYNNKVKLYN